MGIVKRLRKPIIIILVLGVGLLLWHVFIAAGERVTFYQTYGYKEGDNWVIRFTCASGKEGSLNAPRSGSSPGPQKARNS